MRQAAGLCARPLHLLLLALLWSANLSCAAAVPPEGSKAAATAALGNSSDISTQHGHNDSQDAAMHSAAEPNDPQQLEWPGLSSDGVIVEQLRQADPYAPAQPGQQQHDGKPHVAFHLAITSCDSRRGWARLLSNTLLSVMASEVHPTTITVIWCRTWPGVGKEPSLFANWRLSSRIKVLYMPPAYDTTNVHRRKQTNYLMALNVPLYHGMPNLPLLIIEDDIVFAPSFNDQLASAIRQVSVLRGNLADTGGATQGAEAACAADTCAEGGAEDADTCTADVYIMTLYMPAGPVEPVDLARARWQRRDREQYNPWRNMRVRASCLHAERWAYGTQAVLFSPNVVPGVRALFSDTLQGKPPPGVDATTAQDLMILAFNKLFSIVPCTTHPSLVDHLGISSSLFGDGSDNTRFHRAFAFPFKAELPDDDVDGTW